ncbi:MAG: AIR synthase-related protein [Phycisphaerales bacterium]
MPPSTAPHSPVHRIEVLPKPGHADPIGAAVARDAAAIGLPVRSARASHVYLIQAPLSPTQLETVRTGLLADPVTEEARIGASPAAPGSPIVEVHPLPGVMDPVAQSVQLAIHELVGIDAQVSTGWRYDLDGLTPIQAEQLAGRLLANPVIQRVVSEPYHPASFPVGKPHDHAAVTILLTTLADDELTRLSRDAHLFLSLDEMKAIQAHYRQLGREPRDIELETLAQTWSEHCVHKTLKANVRYKPGTVHDTISWINRPGHTVNSDGSVTIANLLKSTVAAATFALIDQGIDWTLSVFKDNSGVIALDDQFGVCIKVETHNHPSAIEPYGGAATGAGGCIRDVIGTGLGAKPIANTDVFCVAFPDDSTSTPPPGTLPPRRILQQVVAGVRDYGNRMGIPTVNGAVAFDNRYVGNPLVFCGCIGLIPRAMVKGAARRGDRIIALGGRTGRDGIHGATFSSTELEHTAADEFAHAVQIGNAITEKQTLDAILRARDFAGGPLYHGLTDCGAGGFSSAVGEMGSQLGAEVHLEKAPLKYDGLSYTEIWISEAQERMVLAVPQANVEKLRAICAEEGVEMADLGVFGTPGDDLVLKFRGEEVGRLSMHFLHDGIPMPTREAVWEGGKALGTGHWASGKPDAAPSASPSTQCPVPDAFSLKDTLFSLLSHPNIASKHWIIRQYDHEVQGNTIVKPLVGPVGRGPSDGSVIEPVAGSGRGIAVACGLQTGLGDPAIGGDPYLMALAAIDECVRNLVCVGADPDRTAILDNFCWPSCGKPENMGALVRACEGCYDGAMAYRTPFVSGKDSLNNQFKYVDPTSRAERLIEIPPTLLITGLSIVPAISRCVTMDAKQPGNILVLVGETQAAMGGSHFQQVCASQKTPPLRSGLVDGAIPRTNLKLGPAAARTVASLITSGLVRSAHDVSDGGLLCSVAEMVIAGSSKGRPIGAQLTLASAHVDPIIAAFSESPSRYVLEVTANDAPKVLETCRAAGIPAATIGRLDDTGTLTESAWKLSAIVGDLAAAWLKPLGW